MKRTSSLLKTCWFFRIGDSIAQFWLWRVGRCAVSSEAKAGCSPNRRGPSALGLVLGFDRGPLPHDDWPRDH
jgi:hypothetical protein